MNMKLVYVAAASLLAGAAAGWLAKPAGTRASDAPADAPKAGNAVDVPASNHEKALRARIKELEFALARKHREERTIPSKRSEAMPEKPESARGRDFGARFLGDVERMKKEEPERYAAMTNNIAAADRMRSERTKGKLDFLSSVDTGAMTPEGKAVHERLQELMVARERLEERRHSLGEMDESERRRYIEEVHETDREIRELSLQERDNLLRQTAGALGFSGGEADEIIETVKGIYEATDNGFGGMSRHRRRPSR